MTVELARRYERPEAAGQVAAALAADNPAHLDVRAEGGELRIRVVASSASSARATLEDLLACIQVAERSIGIAARR